MIDWIQVLQNPSINILNANQNTFKFLPFWRYFIIHYGKIYIYNTQLRRIFKIFLFAVFGWENSILDPQLAIYAIINGHVIILLNLAEATLIIFFIICKNVRIQFPFFMVNCSYTKQINPYWCCQITQQIKVFINGLQIRLDIPKTWSLG